MIRNLSIFMFSIVALATAPSVYAQAESDLRNSSGFEYDIQTSTGNLDDGRQVPTGRSDACDGCWDLLIDGAQFVHYGPLVLLHADREQRIGAESMSGLEVVRRVFVPADANFVRYLEILHNPTGSPITVDVKVDTNLGSDSNTTVRDSSADGSLVVDTDDDWMISSDSNPDSGDPVILSLWQRTGGSTRADDVFIQDGDDEFYFSWTDVEVPAGGTVILMHIGAMSLSVADAVTVADEFHHGESCVMFLRGMTGSEIDAIANWDFADDDEDGLPDCWESGYGFNPANNNAAGDPDGDGLTNLEELQAGLNPTSSDTDGDGLSDSDELDVHDTDPHSRDTDGDHIPDGNEVSIGLNPLEPTVFFESSKVMVTSGEFVRQSDVAVDSQGQVHVTWVQSNSEGGATAAGGDTIQTHAQDFVFYRLYDADGGPLMDAEVVSVTFGRAPSIAVDSTGQAFIAWHGENADGVWLGVPGAATPDGVSAPQTEPGEPLLLSEVGAHVRITVDGDDNIHAVWREGSDPYEIHYAKISGNGEFLVEPTLLLDSADWNLSLNLALDPDGNVHIVWTDNHHEEGSPKAYYLMASGTDGSVLIGRTRVAPSLESKQRHSDVVVDASGRVHIVWSNRESGSASEVFYAQVDPSLHAQDGSDGDMTTIGAVAAKRLTADNQRQSHYSTVSIGGDGNLMLLWVGEATADRGNGNRLGPLWTQRFDLSGNAVSSPMALYWAHDQSSFVLRSYARGSEDWITWVESQSEVFIQNSTPVAPPAVPNGQATVTTSAGTIVFSETIAVTVLPAAAQASAPSGFVFPDGLVRVVVGNLTPGASVDVTITFPSVIPDDAVYYKWNSNDGWTPFSFTRTANPNQVVLTLVDGGAGDSDGVANGYISDPGGFAVPTAPPAVVVTSSGSGGGGGCAMTTGSRAFDPLLPLLLILAMAGLLRRRSYQGRLN